MLRIRHFMMPDREPLAALYAQCRLAANWLPAAWQAEFHFEYDTAGELLLVAVEENGALAGFISVWEPESFIHHLYVREHLRRQGIGRALLAALESHLRPPWRLKCQRANTQAMQFYAAQGWKQAGSGADEFGQYWVLEWPEKLHGQTAVRAHEPPREG